ncbi:MAG: hypothetical protein ACRC8S_05700 [Fimbriiglobus sp.]
MFRIGELLLFLLLAPPSLNDLTPLERETTGFSGAISRGLAAEWQSPTTASQNGDLTVSLVLRGVLNPAEVRVPSVEDLGLDDKIWQTLDAKPTIETDTDQVTIRYLVRVKVSGPVEWPEYPVIYYHPDRAEGKHFVTTYAERKVITVTAPPTDNPPRYDWPFVKTSPNTRFHLPIWGWVMVLPLVPLLYLAGLRLARRFFPEAQDRERRAWLRQLRDVEKTASTTHSGQAMRELLQSLARFQPPGIEPLMESWEAYDFGPQDYDAFHHLQTQTLTMITQWRSHR